MTLISQTVVELVNALTNAQSIFHNPSFISIRNGENQLISCHQYSITLTEKHNTFFKLKCRYIAPTANPTYEEEVRK